MERNYVLYHANCFDGSGAAYAAWRALGDENTTYIPAQYNDPVPEIESGSNVYIVDFSYPRDVLTGLLDASKKLVVLDHHKTAKEALEGFPGALFDMDKSGAVMAWEYFHPNVEAPKLLKHIQDRDLWKWNLDGTREVTAALRLIKDFRDYDKAVDHLFGLEHLYSQGSVKIQFDEMEVAAAMKKAIITQYPMGVDRPMLTCAFLNTTILVSEIGSKLCTDLPVQFSLSYFIEKSGDVVFSFRSTGDFDVSVLAKQLGGGGHRGAAGARVESEAGMRLIAQLYRNRVE